LFSPRARGRRKLIAVNLRRRMAMLTLATLAAFAIEVPLEPS